MTERTARMLAAVLALSGLYVAAWGLANPRSFFESFPGFGRHWVRVDGPYNEHLVRDVGAFYLALSVLALIAVARTTALLLRLTGVVWTVFSLPHLAYHAAHLDKYSTSDAVLNMLALGGTLVLALALVLSRLRTS